jgi:hypothetical protein|tara:strand:+ start:125 stop:874 length:750 start_codon:yes stop_codon:yes gene_type:complete
MAATIKISLGNLEKRLTIYEQTQVKFAGKKALTQYAKRAKTKEGFIAKKYKMMFRSPVLFTLNSTFTVQKGIKLDIGVKDALALKKGKGNPAAFYLYPAIGGGSTSAYATQFTQYLLNRNFMSNGDYPFAVLGNNFIKTDGSGRVRRYIYRNVQFGLAKTRDKEVKGRSKKNGKIQDARVIAFKSNKGKFKKGIYREVSNKKGSYLSPLFMFKPVPTQKPKQTFRSIIQDSSKKIIPELWFKEIKELAK